MKDNLKHWLDYAERSYAKTSKEDYMFRTATMIEAIIQEVLDDVIGEEVEEEFAFDEGYNTHHGDCIVRAKDWGYEEK